MSHVRRVSRLSLYRRGLCASRGKIVYEEALSVAAFIERYFEKSMARNYYILRALDKSGRLMFLECVYLAHVRRRTRKTRISHVFIAATVEGSSESEELLQVSLRERSLRRPDFTTSWAGAFSCNCVCVCLITACISRFV